MPDQNIERQTNNTGREPQDHDQPPPRPEDQDDPTIEDNVQRNRFQREPTVRKLLVLVGNRWIQPPPITPEAPPKR